MTRILTYTPSVEAYIAVTTKQGTQTIDVSDDIVTFSVNLNVNNPSTFNMSLQNVKGKYTGRFLPMDRIVIYLTKISRVPAFAGYIKKADYYKLNNGDLNISGQDTLYRLQKLYWDRQLVESQLLAMNKSKLWDTREEYWRSAVNILTKVANWSPDQISVGNLPDDVLDWAADMYQARLEDTQGLEMVQQVYDMLQTTGVTLSGGVSGGNSSGGEGTASDANVEAAVKWAIAIANDDSHGYSQPNRTGNPDFDCSSLIYYSLINNGWTTKQLDTYPFNTTGMLSKLPGSGWKKYKYNGDSSALKRGDIMWSSSHTEWYIGGNQTCGAHHDENGDIQGRQPGDQTGKEISVTALASGYTDFFRFG